MKYNKGDTISSWLQPEDVLTVDRTWVEDKVEYVETETGEVFQARDCFPLKPMMKTLIDNLVKNTNAKHDYENFLIDLAFKPWWSRWNLSSKIIEQIRKNTK